MKKKKQIFYLTMVITLTALISSCNQDAAPSLFSVEPKGATPVISSIVPANDALAGVTEISITGSNFSRVKEENFVFFGTTQATVLQASSTNLVVKAPALIKNNLDLKIAVQGVEDFSNTVKYNLLEAVGVYYAFAKGIEDPMTVTVDKNENVFVYLKDRGIKKISSTGVLTDFAPRGAESFYVDMKMGPSNEIYGTRPGTRAIFKNVEGLAGATYQVFPTGVNIASFDFDKNKNIWAAGSGNKIFSVSFPNPTKDTTSFNIDYTVTSVRVFNDYLYLAGKNTTEEAIYRYKINTTKSLGAKEKYFDIGAKYGLNKVQVGVITFAEDGELLLGTDQTDSFIIVNSSGTASNFYPGVISPITKSIGWGTKKNLFYIREYLDAGATVHTLVRVDMQKLSAPYYGRQ